MAFKLQTMDVGQTPPMEYYPTADGTIVLGEALTMTSGKLVKCGATAKPDYISVGPVNEDSIVPVIRVQPYLVFETTLQAAGTSLKEGDKVTLYTDGLQVTATTASGVATIDQMLGTAVGDPIRVRF